MRCGDVRQANAGARSSECGEHAGSFTGCSGFKRIKLRFGMVACSQHSGSRSDLTDRHDALRQAGRWTSGTGFGGQGMSIGSGLSDPTLGILTQISIVSVLGQHRVDSLDTRPETCVDSGALGRVHGVRLACGWREGLLVMCKIFFLPWSTGIAELRWP